MKSIISNWISILNEQGREYIEKELIEYEKNSDIYPIVLYMCKNSGISIEKFLLQINNNNSIDIINFLVEKEYVKKYENKNQEYEIKPTEKAEVLANKIKELENNWINIIKAKYSLEDINHFAAFLKKNIYCSSLHRKDYSWNFEDLFRIY